MERKTIGTIFGICCAVLALTSSPTVKADGHEADEAALPDIFTPDDDFSLGDGAVAQLQAITGVQRLAKMAARDEELKEKMYMEPRGALARAGVILHDDLEITVTKDDESGNDAITIKGEGFSNTQAFDSDGELDRDLWQQYQTGMQTRGETCQDNYCKAALTCFGADHVYPYRAYPISCLYSRESTCVAVSQLNSANYHYFPCDTR